MERDLIAFGVDGFYVKLHGPFPHAVASAANGHKYFSSREVLEGWLRSVWPQWRAHVVRMEENGRPVRLPDSVQFDAPSPFAITPPEAARLDIPEAPQRGGSFGGAGASGSYDAPASSSDYGSCSSDSGSSSSGSSD